MPNTIKPLACSEVKNGVMKKEESQLLNDLGKDAGFKVPDGFFEDFNARVAQSLPDVTITEVNVAPSLWVRVRPYLYMAATFAGIWGMMQVFNQFNGSADHAQRISEIAAGIPNDTNADELIMSGVASDYDILTYEDSVMADEPQQTQRLP